MYCILVAGMPASGKSTIAVRISESLGIPMLSKDSIKEVLFGDLGFHSRAEKVQLGTAAMHILYYAAAQLMKVGKPFIPENNFEDASIPGIMALLETHHYTAVTVRFTGDPEVIYRRFAVGVTSLKATGTTFGSPFAQVARSHIPFFSSVTTFSCSIIRSS